MDRPEHLQKISRLRFSACYRDATQEWDTEQLRTGLAGLRGQLAAAQRQDPRLTQIISYLKKEPAGSYLAEPRSGQLAETRARAYKYRLTNDNLLVAKFEGAVLVLKRSFFLVQCLLKHRGLPDHSELLAQTSWLAFPFGVACSNIVACVPTAESCLLKYRGLRSLEPLSAACSNIGGLRSLEPLQRLAQTSAACVP